MTVTIQELRFRLDINQVMRDSVGSIENALNYLTDNFVIMRKTDISGISEHVCDNCPTFQFQDIKDIGFDLTARERPRVYLPWVMRQINCKTKIPDSCFLAMLTNSIFKGNKYLEVKSDIIPPDLANLHLPLIKFECIAPDHWTWMPISRKKILLTNTGLKDFIMLMGGMEA